MKKSLTLIPVLVLAGLLLMGVGTVQAQSSFTAGDLIKLPDISTVYYYGFDGKRHAFPNEPVYFSWYTNFEGIKTITYAEMTAISLGKNVVVRPGTNLIKIQSDSKVYAVEPYGVLRQIRSEYDAVKLYGSDWAKRVIDLNVALMPDYTIRETLPGNPTVYPEGTIYRMTGGNNTVYLWRNGKKLAFDGTILPESCRYQTKYIVTVGSGFYFGGTTESMTHVRPIIVDVAQTLTEETATLASCNCTGSYCNYNCTNGQQGDVQAQILNSDYSIGDRVVYLGGDPYAGTRFNETSARNSMGTVMRVGTSDLGGQYSGMRIYLIRFDNNISGVLRDEYCTPYGYCAWIHETSLRNAQNNEQIQPQSAAFAIGDRVIYMGGDPKANLKFNTRRAMATVGTITRIDESELGTQDNGMRMYLVRFDNYVAATLRGEFGVPYGYCAWIYEINLRKVQ